jgi:hypothetical protein
LPNQAANWGTPRDKDWKSSKGTGKHHRQQLGLQVHQTSIHGEEFYDAGPNSNLPWPSPRVGKTDKLESNVRNATGKGKKLNPLFVEWLMGLPLGWSDYRASVTPLSPWLRRWRSLLYGEG